MSRIGNSKSLVLAPNIDKTNTYITYKDREREKTQKKRQPSKCECYCRNLKCWWFYESMWTATAFSIHIHSTANIHFSIYFFFFVKTRFNIHCKYFTANSSCGTTRSMSTLVFFLSFSFIRFCLHWTMLFFSLILYLCVRVCIRCSLANMRSLR